MILNHGLPLMPSIKPFEEAFERVGLKKRTDFKSLLTKQALLHSLLDTISKYITQTEIKNLPDFFVETNSKKFSTLGQLSKHCWQFVLSLEDFAKSSKEFFLGLQIFNMAEKAFLYSKYYLRCRKVIQESLFGISRDCDSLDNVELQTDQWVPIVNRLFNEMEPTEIVNHFSEALVRHKKVYRDNSNYYKLHSILFIEICFSEFEKSKPKKLATNNSTFHKTTPSKEQFKSSPNRSTIDKKKKDPEDLNYYDLKEYVDDTTIPKENEIDIKKENAYLRQELTRLKIELNRNQKALSSYSEATTELSYQYKESLSYAYHLQSTLKNIFGIIYEHDKGLFFKVAVRPSPDPLPGMYKVLGKTKEQLLRSGIEFGYENFDEFFRSLGAKSFKDKFPFERYDSPPKRISLSSSAKKSLPKSTPKKEPVVEEDQEEEEYEGAPAMQQDTLELGERKSMMLSNYLLEKETEIEEKRKSSSLKNKMDHLAVLAEENNENMSESSNESETL